MCVGWKPAESSCDSDGDGGSGSGGGDGNEGDGDGGWGGWVAYISTAAAVAEVEILQVSTPIKPWSPVCQCRSASPWAGYLASQPVNQPSMVPFSFNHSVKF